MPTWEQLDARISILERSELACNRHDDVMCRLDQLEKKLMAAIDDLQAAVQAEDTVIDSAVALLNGLGAQLKAAGTDPAKLQQLQSDIATRTQSLANAVANNTAPPPAVPGA